MGHRSAPQLVCVDPHRIAEFWPPIALLLKRAILRTDLNCFDEIERDVRAGRSLVWLVWSGEIEAAVITSLIKTDMSKVCVLTACGGKDMRRWLALLETIEVYARAEGCSRMRIFGRKGWQRVLANYWIYRMRLGQPTPDLDALAAGNWPTYTAEDSRSGRGATYAAN